MLQDKNSFSPLNLALDRKDAMLVNSLIDLCIKWDQLGFLYSDCISALLYDMKN